MPVRVAVIGTGFGALVQIPGFQLCDDVEVVAVASGRIERARQVADRYRIPHAFDDYRAMLDAVPIDLVSVVTPPYLHYPMVMAAIERGKHVLCEKPFALNGEEAKAMLEAAERQGVVHAIDHEFRYLPARARFKELVDEGFLGEVRVVRALDLMTGRADPNRPWTWWSDAEKGGGMLGAIGSHYVDTLHWMFGEAAEVGALLDVFIRERPLPGSAERRPVTADDTASLLLKLTNGSTVTVQLSAVAPHSLKRLEAFGSAGSLILEDDERLLAARVGEAIREVEVPERLRPRKRGEQTLIGPFVVLAERMLARIRGESGADFPTFRDGVAVQAVLDAARLAAIDGRLVAPDRM